MIHIRPFCLGAVRFALELCMPRRCPGCAALIAEAQLFCAACATSFEPVSPGLLEQHVPIYAVGRYAGALAHAITELKYQGKTDLALPLGRLLGEALGEQALPPGTLLVPVPLHRLRLAQRGYNQSALVARHVASELGLPHAPLALRRRHWHRCQVGLDVGARRANVQDAFEARDFDALQGKNVVLVDDVMTTGATLSACITALRAAAACPVAVTVLARADFAA